MLTAHDKFDHRTHLAFAQLSGDFNPIHIDAIAARRTQTGAPIVHGIHSLLRLCEHIISSDARLPTAQRLRATFTNPIYIGEEYRLDITHRSSSAVRARMLVSEAEVVSVSIDFFSERHSKPVAAMGSATSISPPAVPNELSMEDMGDTSGCLSVSNVASRSQAMFPFSARYFGAQSVAALACSSCLVGMIVPGLHSLLAGLDIFLSEETCADPDLLCFSVTSIKARHRLAQIAIRSGNLYGALQAFVRHAPVRQPSMVDAGRAVRMNEFRGCTALIVGGSRGLGEVAAKLISAGGGRVVITYSVGKSNADAVAGEIRSQGQQCDTVQYDVRIAASQQLASCVFTPTHLYYFATPLIFRRKTVPCDLTAFCEFNTFYISGFLDIMQTCLRLRPAGLRVLYPSSVAVSTQPANMTEYAMSKAAGEILCSSLQASVPGIRILTRRLPRILTDQTGSASHVDAADPIEILLPIIRELHSDPSDTT